VVLTDDPALQSSQLVRVFKWYTAKNNSLETKEGALAIRLKEKKQEKKRELQK